MANYKIRDPDFITPDLDIKRLSIALKKFSDRNLIELNDNEYNGQLMYKSTGDKRTTTTQTISTEATQTFFEIDHAVADPIRDEDVDRERMISKGTIDRDTITKRSLLFVQSDDLYQMLYLSSDIEEVNNLATFLLRITNKGDPKPTMEKSSKIVFSFEDQKNMRGPQIKVAKEKDQKVTPDKAEEKPSMAAAVQQQSPADLLGSSGLSGQSRRGKQGFASF